jgi:hypothetical protein
VYRTSVIVTVGAIVSAIVDVTSVGATVSTLVAVGVDVLGAMVVGGTYGRFSDGTIVSSPGIPLYTFKHT